MMNSTDEDIMHYCMPRIRSVKEADVKGWILKNCPRCEAKCWEMPLTRQLRMQGAKGLCTSCLLRHLKTYNKE